MRYWLTVIWAAFKASLPHSLGQFLSSAAQLVVAWFVLWKWWPGKESPMMAVAIAGTVVVFSGHFIWELLDAAGIRHGKRYLVAILLIAACGAGGLVGYALSSSSTPQFTAAEQCKKIRQARFHGDRLRRPFIDKGENQPQIIIGGHKGWTRWSDRTLDFLALFDNQWAEDFLDATPQDPYSWVTAKVIDGQLVVLNRIYAEKCE